MLARSIDELAGWHVVTDLTTAIGTVPLVAVGPAGAFVVERADAPDARSLAAVPERGLIHAWAQAKHLERRRVGGTVGAVLALTGPDAPSGRRRGVHVLADALVAPWLDSRPEILSPGEATALAARLADQPQPQPAQAPAVLAA